MYGMKTLISIILTVISFGSFGQKIDQMESFRNIESDNYFRIIYDNDYFSETDRDYTQGYSLEYSSPVLAKNPINKILLKNKSGIKKYGLLIEHIGFTPLDIRSEEIQFGDRPFASAIMLKTYLISIDSNKKTRLSSSFNFGLIGPGAFGREIQTGIHRAIDYTIPLGWHNQIENDVVINYGIDLEKQLVRYRDFFTLQANAKGKLGTLYTNSSLGFNFTIGKINSPFTSPKKSSKFQICAYAQPLINFIGYDATLQGGLFNNRSKYTIPNADIERITYQLNYGIVIKINKLYLEYSRAEMTREHSKGIRIGWGGVKIGYSF